MKELSIKEKAKAYDEAIKRAEAAIKVAQNQKEVYGCIITIFPELKNEDEKIRKELIKFVKVNIPNEERYIAWLEKQGEQKPAGNIVETWKDMRLEVYQQASGNRHEPNCSDDTTKMFSLKDIDEIVKKTSEQRPADKVEPKDYSSIDPYFGKPNDKVEPKFKVGQTIKKEGFNLGFTIVKIEDGFYYNDMGDYFPFTAQDDWELVKQKSTWSEEDASNLEFVIRQLRIITDEKHFAPVIDWLKSLKDRCSWKPSEEQIKALEHFVRSVGESGYASPYDQQTKLLYSLLEQLKRL